MKHPASIKSKLAILWSHLFPNVKDFIVTLVTTFFILYVLVQLKNNGNTGNKVNQQISSYKVKYPKIISKVEILQSSNFAYIWLLNKPYENEVIFAGQNLLLKNCKYLEISYTLRKSLDLLMLKILDP